MSIQNQVKAQRASTISSRRDSSGPIFFSQGFRPLFLAAALWAILSLSLWINSWLGAPFFGLTVDSNWHMHEMLFGFAPAAIAGFLLTAIPNWTGRLPVRGTPLMLLTGIWLAGRIAMLLVSKVGAETAAFFDSAFLIIFSLLVFREIIAGKNWRNLKVGFIVAGLALSNVVFHLETLGTINDTKLASRAAISLLILLIALIGGRIIPSFTRNVLKRRGAKRLPAQSGFFDRLTLISTLIIGISFTLAPDTWLTAALALLCSGLHTMRLSRWRGLAVLFEPMLWVLHLSYLWIAIGFGLLAIQPLLATPMMSAAIHAFTIGAFASMILAVMSRASRGHTKRSLTADRWTLLIYISISLAAVFRVFGSIAGQSTFHLLASLFWILAFGVFVICYWTTLTGPKSDETART